MFGPEQPIVVHIESYGGSVDGFFVIYDALISCGNPIVTYTTGIAASAGAYLFSCAAPKGNRIIGKHATIMLHDIQLSVGGDIKNVEEEIKYIKKLNMQLREILIKSMGINNDQYEKMFKSKTKGHDLNLSALESLNLGIADKIGSLRITPISYFNVDVVEANGDDEPPTKKPKRVKN